MRIKFLLLISIILFFGACSSKQYYTPKTITTSISPMSSEKIVNFNRDGATLYNGKVLTKQKPLKLKLKNGYRFINSNPNWLLISTKDGRCKVIKNKKAQDIKFPTELISGIVIGNNLVYLLRDNNFGIYDLSQKAIVYNNKGEKALSADMRITNPIQIENLIVVPLLNGKLAVLDLKAKKVIKDIFISIEDKLNNIIFLKQVGNTLISATPYKLITVNKQGKREFEKAISDVKTDNNYIFAFLKDGTISKLDLTLTVQDEKKFKFAHFSVVTLYKGRIYALDKQGYLIVSNKDFTKYRVYEVPEVDGYSFASGRYIYYDGNKIDLNNLDYK